MQDQDWLIEQIIRLTLDAHGLHEMDRRYLQAAKAAKKSARLGRVRVHRVDRRKRMSFTAVHPAYDRQFLVRAQYILAAAPAKGTALPTSERQTPAGREPLLHAKDFLLALPFGDEMTNTQANRI